MSACCRIVVCFILMSSLVGCSRKGQDTVASSPQAVSAEGAPETNPEQSTNPSATGKGAVYPKDAVAVPVMKVAELAKEMIKSENIDRSYGGKVLRVEGFLNEVYSRGAGTKENEVEATILGPTDDPDEKKWLKFTFHLKNAADAEKLGPGQQVTLQGTYFIRIGSSVSFRDATVVAAGPVAITQAQIEQLRKEEPKAVATLEKMGVNCKKGPFSTSCDAVRLTDNELTADGQIKPEILTPLSQLVELKELELYDTRISDAGLAGLKKLIGVRTLMLYRTKIGDEGLAHLKDVRGLRWVEISYGSNKANGSSVTDAGLAHLKGMKGWVEVVDSGGAGLTMGGACITDAGLASLTGSSNLMSLDLQNNKLTDAGLAHLNNLWTLNRLNLSRTEVRGKGLVNFKGFRKLEYLDLSNCPVDDAGLESIAMLPALYDLDLQNTKVGDEGMTHLARSPALSRLNLQGTSVGDTGLSQLASIKSLKILSLSTKSKATPEGINKLKASLPGLEVYSKED
jgi:Leucine-rich repeat (LRR) protein